MTAGDVALADIVVSSVVSDSGTVVPVSNAFTIAGGTGISTSATGSTITITATGGGGGGGWTWNEVTDTTQTAVVENGYVTNNASAVTVTLPAVAAFGERVAIVGKGAGGWVLDYGTGVTIHYSGLDTTTTTGALASETRYDAVEVICITANTEWTVRNGTGNLTVT